MTMYNTNQTSANHHHHHPQIKLNGGPILDYTTECAGKVRYNLRTNPESDCQERQRIKRLMHAERKINTTLTICATLQCFFASCFLAIGLYLTIAKAWGYKSGANFIAAFLVFMTGMAGYRAARSKLRMPIKWNCICAWTAFTIVYIPIFLIGLLGAFLSLHHPYLDEYQFPKDTMTLAVHGSSSIVAMFGFLVTLIQATVKTNSRFVQGHYTKTVSPVILTVCENRPTSPPTPPVRKSFAGSNHVISSNHLAVPEPFLTTQRNSPTCELIATVNHHSREMSSFSSTSAAGTSRTAGSTSQQRTCSDVTTRV